MRERITPSNQVKGYILFKKGYVTIGSKGFVEIKSEEHPNERPYLLRSTNGYVRHTCGAALRRPNVLCKHALAYYFATSSMLPPDERIVEVFEKYRKSRIASREFDKDVGLYALNASPDLTNPGLADHLWMCLFARVAVEKRPRFDESVLGEGYESLLASGRVMAARLKAVRGKENPIRAVLDKCDGMMHLGDVIMESEQEGIENAKTIIYKAFKEGLLPQKDLGKIYTEAYKRLFSLYSFFTF